ncbi:TylF/MycF/NovP-related O-methyltransferase [Candidatus Methanoperedens sp. BLZ2]|uniref:TylF/MycF/NovP-related O-methyltransferase n=1 Tax=Candidatus Methanoperedens sp. BLZ2 TaxID=2035255 RepID=UPI000BE390E6|nr:TylF/MycF/NovP-related O-methyltransferase [Candidatus Methanoperedens sp. BLZ2]KAB2946159.1 MAG: hypothetical protein F9K14_08450 [Candidatus Methanoperedens sp.]MBZ0175098.1 TylF/MycF family methyltransferase [Candidatus Methanoperedens nitroreducens]
MINQVKNLVRKNKIVVHTRLFFRRMSDSWKYVPVKEYANIKKLFLFWELFPYSQQNYASLSNVYDLAKVMEKNNTRGSFVECGVWKGGCAAVMAIIANKAGNNRKIWLFDSFEGMPEATGMDSGKSAMELAEGKMSGKLIPVGTNIALIEDVKKLFFEKLNLNKSNIIFAKGWFQETIPKYKDQIDHIAILRIDGDWYESTKTCLENLYDQVIEGGYIIIDDYGFFPGCKKAVDEFISMRNLKVELIKIDYSRVYFKKLD